MTGNTGFLFLMIALWPRSPHFRQGFTVSQTCQARQFLLSLISIRRHTFSAMVGRLSSMASGLFLPWEYSPIRSFIPMM